MDIDEFEDSTSSVIQEGERLSVRFKTPLEDPALRVPPTPLFVPADLTRYGASQLVNHLLQLGAWNHLVRLQCIVLCRMEASLFDIRIFFLYNREAHTLRYPDQWPVSSDYTW